LVVPEELKKRSSPPTVFFSIGFNLIELTTQLVLDVYLVRFHRTAGSSQLGSGAVRLLRDREIRAYTALVAGEAAPHLGKPGP
jgi:hypothetical protein